MKQMRRIQQIIKNDLNQVKKLKAEIEKSLKKAPEGSLIVSKSKATIQFFHKEDHTQKKGKYIKKSNMKFIAQLAQKDYDQALYRTLEKREIKLEKVLKNLPEKDLEEIYEKLSDARKDLVNPRIISNQSYIEQWLAVEYEGNSFHDEYKKFETERGEKVRSKSEKIIADKLNAMNIPYRYEYPLHTKNMGTIYPDFTILLPSSRTEIYLEHFGMMDDPEYCEKALIRIQELAKNEIVLGTNFIATFESSSVSLDTKCLEFLKTYDSVPIQRSLNDI